MRVKKNNDIVMNKRSPRRVVSDVMTTLIMSVLVLIILYPFIVMLLVSLKDTKEALVSPNSIPSKLHWEKYELP